MQDIDDSVMELIDQNKSMMDVVPSANYKKLLHDFSNVQGNNSSDIIEEDYDDDADQ
jgi:hypothetical protein